MNESSIFHSLPSAISSFLGIPLTQVVTRLGRGFWHNHIDATNDFLEAGVDQENHGALFDWYKTTEAYIWELAAWHWADRGNGITQDHQEVFDACVGRVQDVLVLGDGIGTLTMQLKLRGLNPTYNDIEGSRTAQFAQFRFGDMGIPSILTDGWEPRIGDPSSFDAVVAHAFFEHIPNVDDWVVAVHQVLRPGGFFFVKNDWIMGTSADDKNSAIPMHLESNLLTATRWFEMLPSIGFRHLGGSNLEMWERV